MSQKEDPILAESDYKDYDQIEQVNDQITPSGTINNNNLTQYDREDTNFTPAGGAA